MVAHVSGNDLVKLALAQNSKPVFKIMSVVHVATDHECERKAHVALKQHNFEFLPCFKEFHAHDRRSTPSVHTLCEGKIMADFNFEKSGLT